MTTAVMMAGLVAAVTPAPLVVMLVLVGRGDRLRQALAAAAASVVTLAVSAELFRAWVSSVPSMDDANTSMLLGVAFVVVALVVFARARRGRGERALPWVDMLDSSGVALAALIMFLLTVCNIKNQALVAAAMQDADGPAASLLYALVGASGVLALLIAGAIHREGHHRLRTAHDWLERHQTNVAICTFAVVGCVLLVAGVT